MNLLEMVENDTEIIRLLDTTRLLATENINDTKEAILKFIQECCPELEYFERTNGTSVDVVLKRNGKDFVWWFKDDKDFPITLCTIDGGIEVNNFEELLLEVLNRYK